MNQETEKNLTKAPKTQKFTVNTALGGNITNNPYHPGESVEEHKNLEEANLLLAEDEINQQNENL